MGDVIVRRAGEGERLAAGPTESFVKVAGDSTGHRMSVVEMRLDGAWDGPPSHVHREIDHLWWVVDGMVELTVGHERIEATTGDCVFVPAGVTHRFSTATSDGAVVVEVDSPRALDGYFRDLASTLGSGTAPDPVVVGEIMRRHDTEPAG